MKNIFFRSDTVSMMYDQLNESDPMSWDIPVSTVSYYSPIFGTDLAMPEWEALITLVCLSAVILTTIVGNILVKQTSFHLVKLQDKVNIQKILIFVLKVVQNGLTDCL
jgi:hypothetical protein